MCAGRNGWRLSVGGRAPTGPPIGTGEPEGLTLRNLKTPPESVKNLPRRFHSACSGSWFSYRPIGEACQTSISAPATGFPSVSVTVPVKNSGGPSVGERTIESPLFITGAPWRQKGPRRLAEVGFSSVPLFIRHTSADRPRLPAISRTSLWLGVVSCPSLATTLLLASNSASVSP